MTEILAIVLTSVFAVLLNVALIGSYVWLNRRARRADADRMFAGLNRLADYYEKLDHEEA